MFKKLFIFLLLANIATTAGVGYTVYTNSQRKMLLKQNIKLFWKIVIFKTFKMTKKYYLSWESVLNKTHNSAFIPKLFYYLINIKYIHEKLLSI